MSYIPKTWVDDEVITAEAMNHLEQGVANEQAGPAGAPGPKGDPGEGVPTGGTTGQVLAKKTAADYDTEWVNPTGGGSSGVSSFNGRTGAVVPAAGDYTAAQVGARPDTWMPTATEIGAIASSDAALLVKMTQEQFDALTTRSPTTLYAIPE